MKIGPCDYNNIAATPEGYVCGACGAHGVKLWREYQITMDGQVLLCAHCLHADLTRKGIVAVVDQGGRWTKPGEFYGYGSDSVDWRVPAVPVAEGGTFWGYTFVPQEGVRWWGLLPLTHDPSPR